MYPQMLNMAKNDPHPQNRIIVIEKLLSKYDQTKFNSFIRQRLIDEPIPSYRRRLAVLLLDRFGTISDFNYLLWYLTQEPVQSNVNSVENRLTIWFVPPKPDSIITITISS